MDKPTELATETMASLGETKSVDVDHELLEEQTEKIFDELHKELIEYIETYFADLTTEKIIGGIIELTKIMVANCVEFSPEYAGFISILEKTIAGDEDIKRIVSDARKYVVGQIKVIAADIVMDIVEDKDPIRIMETIFARLSGAPINDAITKGCIVLAKITITVLTGITIDKETAIILGDAVAAMVLEDAKVLIKPGVMLGAKKGFEDRMRGDTSSMTALIKTRTELLPEKIPKMMSELVSEVESKAQEGEYQYILFGGHECEIPFTIGSLGRINYIQKQVISEEICRHFNLNINTLNSAPIILSESVLLDRLRRKKLSSPNEKMREHLKAFPYVYYFFIDYVDKMRWLHDEVNYFQGILYNPLVLQRNEIFKSIYIGVVFPRQFRV